VSVGLKTLRIGNKSSQHGQLLSTIMQLSYNPPAPSWCFQSPVCSGVSHAARALRRRRTQHHKAPKGRGWGAHVKLLKHPKFVGQLGHKTCHFTIAGDITSLPILQRFLKIGVSETRSTQSLILYQECTNLTFWSFCVSWGYWGFAQLHTLFILVSCLSARFRFNLFCEKLSSMEHHCGPH
jgi:hypothetical protein